MAILQDSPGKLVSEYLAILNFVGAKGDGGGGATRSANFQSHRQTASKPIPSFYRLAALPVAQPILPEQ